MAQLLESAGFRVDMRIDAGAATLAQAVSAFGQAIARPGVKLGFFYYAGHGQEVETKTRDSPDPLDQTFVPYDYRTQDARDGYKTNLRDKEMK